MGEETLSVQMMETLAAVLFVNVIRNLHKNMLQLKTYTLMIITDSILILNSILMLCAFPTVVVLLIHNVVITMLILEHMFFIMPLTKNVVMMDLQQLLDHVKPPKKPQKTRHLPW